MTHRDWLNSLSNEEFAEWLCRMKLGEYDPRMPFDKEMYNRILKALNSEVEDD